MNSNYNYIIRIYLVLTCLLIIDAPKEEEEEICVLILFNLKFDY